MTSAFPFKVSLPALVPGYVSERFVDFGERNKDKIDNNEDNPDIKIKH